MAGIGSFVSQTQQPILSCGARPHAHSLSSPNFPPSKCCKLEQTSSNAKLNPQNQGQTARQARWSNWSHERKKGKERAIEDRGLVPVLASCVTNSLVRHNLCADILWPWWLQWVQITCFCLSKIRKCGGSCRIYQLKCRGERQNTEGQWLILNVRRTGGRMTTSGKFIWALRQAVDTLFREHQEVWALLISTISNVPLI